MSTDKGKKHYFSIQDNIIFDRCEKRNKEENTCPVLLLDNRVAALCERCLFEKTREKETEEMEKGSIGQ
jgi:hypothetical protein